MSVIITVCIACVHTHWLECNQQFVLEVYLQRESSPNNCTPGPVHLDSPPSFPELSLMVQAPERGEPKMTVCIVCVCVHVH